MCRLPIEPQPATRKRAVGLASPLLLTPTRDNDRIPLAQQPGADALVLGDLARGFFRSMPPLIIATE